MNLSRYEDTIEEFAIIADIREKKYMWNFSYCCEQIREKVDTGDYTIKGYENDITIDRKRDTCEIAKNLSKDYPRFQRELIRMTSFKEAYIVCEFSLEDLLNYPDGVKIPRWNKRLIKRDGKSLFKQIESIEEKYKVKFIFAGDRFKAQEIALDIFRKFIEKYGYPKN